MNVRHSNKLAYISFYAGNTETQIFWLDQDSPVPRIFKAKITSSELENAGKKLTTMFSKENINPRRPEQVDVSWLGQISDILLLPMKNELSRFQTLVIAPHKGLHFLPFHLLQIDGSPLGISHAITYVSNLAIYATLLNRGHQRRNQYKHPSISLIAAAREDSAQIQENFSIAPKAYALKTGGMVFENTDATKSALIQYASTCKSFYLSCHGFFDHTKPVDSVLFLSNGYELASRMASDDASYRLSVKDILALDISSKLVILDACLSGVQYLSAGDEPLGFPMAFLSAGSGAVIASNWSVEQNCAKFFMLALTDHWSGSPISLGEAMNRAYRDTRIQYPHPFSWGGFSLFGNNQLLFN